MGKKRTIIAVFAIIFIIILILNTFFYLGVYGIASFKGIPALSIKIFAKNINLNLLSIKQSYPLLQIVLLGSMIVEFFIIILFVLNQRIKPIEKKSEKEPVHPKVAIGKHTRANTDLDSLYEMLKEKKKIKMSVITKTFGINTELAMDWGKILETGGLARIDYPRMGEAELIIIEEEEQQIKQNEKDK